MSRRDETGSGWDIGIVRALNEAYARLLRELEAMRSESTDVAELLSIAACTDELNEKLAHWQRRMDRIEAKARLQARRQALAEDRATEPVRA